MKFKFENIDFVVLGASVKTPAALTQQYAGNQP
jgi:hypothetical protein